MNKRRFAASLVRWPGPHASHVRPNRRHQRVDDREQVEEMNVRMKGSLAGIGAILAKTNDQLVVSRVFPDNPAAKAGLKADQFITAINSIPTAR